MSIERDYRERVNGHFSDMFKPVWSKSKKEFVDPPADRRPFSKEMAATYCKMYADFLTTIDFEKYANMTSLLSIVLNARIEWFEYVKNSKKLEVLADQASELTRAIVGLPRTFTVESIQNNCVQQIELLELFEQDLKGSGDDWFSNFDIPSFGSDGLNAVTLADVLNEDVMVLFEDVVPWTRKWPR